MNLLDSNVGLIFQVETIGDAYMVVGGLPNSCDDHAERVAKMACGMLDVVTNVYSPVDCQPIKVGLHCLFVGGGGESSPMILSTVNYEIS